MSSGAPVQVGKVHAVGHEPAAFHIFSTAVYRRESARYCKFDNLFSLSIEDTALQHEDSFSTPLARGSECGLNILGT
jgi:hypothetical protein